jgi:hypothetical protein
MDRSGRAAARRPPRQRAEGPVSMGMGGNRLIEEGRAGSQPSPWHGPHFLLDWVEGELDRVDRAGMLDGRGLDRKQLWTMA